ncbi:MAG: sugar ABC transporter substrate-binding protein [Spirochaetia bacterium]|nr:sugar ABC transporter substrate-binding protein [Spirochaetia bacterium]
MKKFRAAFVLTVTMLLPAVFPVFAENREEQGQNVITVWNMPPVADRWQRTVWEEERQSFEKIYPGISVKGISREYKPQEFVSVMASGKGPDIVRIPMAAIPAMAKYGFLLKLNDYAEKWQLSDSMPRIMWEAVKIGNDTYGIPNDSYFTTLFYRKDIFAAAGIETPPQNWRQLIEYSEKINSKLPDTWGIAIAPDMSNFMDFIWQAGGDIYSNGKLDLNNRGVVKALKFWNELKWKHNCMPPQNLFYANDVEQLFSAGKIAMMLGTAKQLPVMSRRYGLDVNKVEIVPLPAGDTGIQAWHAGGDAFIINSGVSQEIKDMCWKYIEYILSPLNQLGRYIRLKELNAQHPADVMVFPGDFSCATNLLNRPEFANVKGLLSYAQAEPTYYKWPMIKEDFNTYVLEKIFINEDVDYTQVLADFMARVEEEYHE